MAAFRVHYIWDINSEAKQGKRRPVTFIFLALAGLAIGLGLGWLLFNQLRPPTYHGQVINSEF